MALEIGKLGAQSAGDGGARREQRAFDRIGDSVLESGLNVFERDLDGVDILTFDDQGLVREFTVMLRPYSAATALREMMAAKL